MPLVSWVIPISSLYGKKEEDTVPITPPETSTPLPPSQSVSVAALDRVLEPLEQGNIVFDVPQSMEIDKSKIINLLLSPTKSIKELQLELESEEEIESATVKITNDMEAKLSGKGFTVETLIPERQAVSSQRTTKWAWEITPNESGKQRLNLILSIFIVSNNRQTPYILETFEKNIEVKVSAKFHVSNFLESIWGVVSDNWEWTWTVILVPLGIWVRRRIGQWNRRRLNQRIQNQRTSDRKTPTRRN